MSFQNHNILFMNKYMQQKKDENVDRMTISQIYGRDCSGEGGGEMGLVAVVGIWGPQNSSL